MSKALHVLQAEIGNKPVAEWVVLKYESSLQVAHPIVKTNRKKKISLKEPVVWTHLVFISYQQALGVPEVEQYLMGIAQYSSEKNKNKKKTSSCAVV